VLTISEIVVTWNNTSYRLTRDTILKAFDRASAGTITATWPRYFLQIEQDIKPIDTVLQEIIPVLDRLDNGVSDMMARAFETLGFEVLDRGKKKGERYGR
jgi:hypothetical protein